MKNELRRPSEHPFKIIIALGVILTFGLAVWWFQPAGKKNAPSEPIQIIPHKPASVKPDIKTDEKQITVPTESQLMDYSQIEEDPAFKEMMEKRKAQYGVDGGIDMIVQEDESIKVGDKVIPMRDILDKIRLKEGGLIERDIEDDSEQIRQKRVSELTDKHVEIYGIYVVQPGDNVWNIHFEFLKDYFVQRGVKLMPTADEPNAGKSSGVGRILKFSENMVYIYNIKEDQFADDLNLIHPLSKIVIFNMGRAFSVLTQIDYKNIGQVQFDGETLWIPAKNNGQ